MIQGRVSSLVVLVVFTVLMFFFINRFRKTSVVPIRRVPGLDAIQEAVGRATEMGRPVHYTLGMVSGFEAQTFAGLEVLKHVASQCAEYDARIIVTNARPIVHPVTEDLVRGAFVEAGKGDSFNPDDIKFLSDQQLAYSAGVVGIIERERVAANLMIGQFYAESLIFAEAGAGVKAIQIAGTAMTNQLPFFIATCDYTLIGEDLYAAGAFLSRDAAQMGCLMAQEVSKYASVAVLVLGALLKTAGNDWISSILSK